MRFWGLYLYLLAINLIAFCLYGLDKSRARKKKRRISERALLSVAALGGACGALLAMRTFRHKTRHAKFRYGVPILLAIHILLIVFFFLLLQGETVGIRLPFRI